MLGKTEWSTPLLIGGWLKWFRRGLKWRSLALVIVWYLDLASDMLYVSKAQYARRSEFRLELSIDSFDFSCYHCSCTCLCGLRSSRSSCRGFQICDSLWYCQARVVHCSHIMSRALSRMTNGRLSCSPSIPITYRKKLPTTYSRGLSRLINPFFTHYAIVPPFGKIIAYSLNSTYIYCT